MRILIGSLFVSVILAIGGCTRERADAPYRLDDRIASPFATRADPSAIVVCDPSDCLRCGSEIAAWAEIRRNSPTRVAILVTRELSPAEQRRFARHRIPVDAVIHRRAVRGARSSGFVTVYRGGDIAETTPLGASVTHRTLAEEIRDAV